MTDSVPVAEAAHEPPPKAEAKSVPPSNPAATTNWVVVLPSSGESTASGLKQAADAGNALAALMWPVIVVVIVVLYRKQIRVVLQRAADWTSLKIGPFELSREIKALASQVESLQVDKQVLSAASLANVADRRRSPDEAMSELRKLADEYEHVDIKDWASRVRKKDQLAAEMATLVIRTPISRDELVSESRQGMLMALATTIHTLPERSDANRLIVAAPRARLLHVRYRFMMAVSRLARQDLLAPELGERLLELCNQYLEGADGPLLGRIARTRSALLESLSSSSRAPRDETPD